MCRTLSSFEPNWKRRYNSPPDNLVRDFYAPAFARSCRYDRAVGFFSSRILATISASLDEFVINGGAMRLITSPANLSDEDLEALGKGEEFRTRLRNDLVEAIHRPIPSSVLIDHLKLLTWMVATGKLDVKIALRENPNYYSLFHEKIGVFMDSEGNWMTFTGSPNETVAAACYHAESFPLHRSWASEDQRAFADEERARFEDIWAGGVPNIATWSVGEWIQEPMRKHFGVREPSPDRYELAHRRESPSVDETATQMVLDELSLLPSIPSDLELRDYQRIAVNDWLQAHGRGVFAMATGTGKTITALAAATQVSLHAATQDRPLLVVVVVPLIDLVHQWQSVAEWFGFRPAICHGNISKAERDELKAAFSAARFAKGRRAEMIITTAGSLTPRSSVGESEHFLQRQLHRHRGAMLFIGDEMHSLGTAPRLSALPQQATYRLGLSATPKRHGDEEGTKALMTYFGEPVLSISIKDAIYKYKALVEYDYFPSFVDLTPVEAEEYRKISARIAAAFSNADQDRADVAIRERTRLTQHAANKLVRLRKLMNDGLKNETHQIIYVAEGRSPETDAKQMDEIERMLRREFGMRVERYYGETDSKRRESLQAQLASGRIHALLAMKCLDEGVDIPSVRIGVISASTQNPRQFVQRRGRLLRRDPKGAKSHATIHDFIVMPPSSLIRKSDSEKRLIGAELSRAAELADAARNREVLFEILECAYNNRLDPSVFTWMKLSQEKEMESWIP